jgi:hypothetical protein
MAMMPYGFAAAIAAYATVAYSLLSLNAHLSLPLRSRWDESTSEATSQ